MKRNYIDQLKAILLAGGLSQGELAQRLGVTFVALNRWINDHAKPHRARIDSIHKLYRQVVGFPPVTQETIQDCITKADNLKIQGLWNLIARNQELQDDLLLEHTYNSTSIEGTTFSKKETEIVLFSKGIIPDKSLTEHLEVSNHAAVLRQIFQGKHDNPITEIFIQQLHRELLQGVRTDAGSYSRHTRAIRGVDIALTHPKDISEEMGNLIRAWQNKKTRKSIADIAAFHVHFELIHPFGDGNGRVGRLLMVLQSLQLNYPPVVIENTRKAEYYEVLEHAQRKADGPFICFLVEEMEKTREIIQKHIPATP